MRVLLAVCLCFAGPQLAPGETLQIIGAGLPRTGTQTLALALDKLGYRVIHSEGRDLKEPGVHIGSGELLSLIVKAARGVFRGSAGFEAFEPVLSRISELGVNATLDVPWNFLVDELLRRFPEAKVILTVRDAESWCILEGEWTSWYDSYYRAHRVLAMLPAAADPGLAYKKQTNGQLPGCEHVEGFPPWPPAPEDRRLCISSFNLHNSRIRTLTPPGSLLVYDVREGWGPLCAFLKRELPPIPFPRRDDVGKHSLPESCSHPTVAGTLAIYVLSVFQLGSCCCPCLCCLHWRRRRRRQVNTDAKKNM